MSDSGGGSGEGALDVLPAEATVKTEPQQVVRARMVHMPAEMLDCHACHLPLKPPIFKVRSSTNNAPIFLSLQITQSIIFNSKSRSCFDICSARSTFYL
jgi:hypothetical protein